MPDRPTESRDALRSLTPPWVRRELARRQYVEALRDLPNGRCSPYVDFVRGTIAARAQVEVRLRRAAERWNEAVADAARQKRSEVERA